MLLFPVRTPGTLLSKMYGFPNVIAEELEGTVTVVTLF